MDISSSTVKDLAVECMDLLKLCSTQGDETLHVRFQNRVADFKLWCDGVGALARMHARLDWRFRERTDDLTVIKGILALFCRFLETYRRSAEGGQPTDEPLRNIDSMLENLALLALAIRQTGKRSRLEKADSKFKLGDHDDLWIHLQCLLFIRRDPAGLTASCLDRRQHRLLEANLRRRNRFLQAQKQSGYLKQPAEPQAPTITTTTTTRKSRHANKTGDISTSKRDVASQSERKTPDAADTELPETSAEVKPPVPSASGHSASVPEDEIKLPLMRPGQRSPAMEVSKTVITSITASASYPSVRVPEGQNSFMCPCCCQPLPRDYATSDSIWRKHLAQDIQPYTCIADDCPTAHTYYSAEADLARHLRDHHRQTWQCPLCDQSPAIFTTEEIMRGHFEKEHGNLGSDEIPGLLSMSRQYGLGIAACPICGESDTMDSPELITHTLEHMHQFSLLSLPWSTEELDVSLDDMWFNPTHQRLLWTPRANEMDQRNGFEAPSVLVRLVSWLESDAVDISKYSADSEKSLGKKNREKLTQTPDYYSDINHVYFADLITNASVRAGTPLERSDTGEAGTSYASVQDSNKYHMPYLVGREGRFFFSKSLGSKIYDLSVISASTDISKSVDDRFVRLEGGRLHGVKVQSQYAILPYGFKFDKDFRESDVLARVRVWSVTDGEAQAQVEAMDDTRWKQIAAGCPAILQELPDYEKFTVGFVSHDNNKSTIDTLEKAWSENEGSKTWLSLCRRDRRDASFTVAVDVNKNLKIQHAPANFNTTPWDDLQPLPYTSMPELIRQLEHIARFTVIKELGVLKGLASSRLASVKVRNASSDYYGQPIPPARLTRLEDKAYEHAYEVEAETGLDITVKNESQRPLGCVILNCGSDLSVELVYPNDWQFETLQVGQEITIPLVMTIPERELKSAKAGKVVIDLLKVMVCHPEMIMDSLRLPGLFEAPDCADRIPSLDGLRELLCKLDMTRLAYFARDDAAESENWEAIHIKTSTRLSEH